jgi:lysophospholipase L1-like esterase
MRQNLKALAFGVAIVIIAFSIFEIVLYCRGFSFNPWLHYKRFGANYEAEDIEYYDKDAELFWKFKPNQVIRSWWVPKAHINSLGLRGDEIGKENKKAIYVLCVGDSGIFGWAVNDSQTFPSVLEQELKKKFTTENIKVINAGVPAYSSYQGVILLERLLKHIKPKIVIFAFGRNDHNDTVYMTDKQRKRLPAIITNLHSLLLNTRAYQWFYMQTTMYMLIYKRDQFYGGQNRKQTVRVPLADFEINIRKAAEISRDNGATLYLITRAQMPAYTEIMRNLSKKIAHIKFIDLKPYSDDQEIRLFSEGEHCGYAKVAHIAAGQIISEDIN